jgi:hypothetical protein
VTDVGALQLALALAHWFNDQTHHRGQAHAVLMGLAGQAPELAPLFDQRLAVKSAVEGHESFIVACDADPRPAFCRSDGVRHAGSLLGLT